MESWQRCTHTITGKVFNIKNTQPKVRSEAATTRVEVLLHRAGRCVLTLFFFEVFNDQKTWQFQFLPPQQNRHRE